MNLLLQVGCGIMGRPYLDAAERIGIPVHLVETEHFLDGWEAPPSVVGTTPLPGVGATAGMRETEWAVAALVTADRVQPGAVLAFNEMHVQATSLVAEAHGLSHIGALAASVSRNKAWQRALLDERGLEQPSWVLANDPSDVRPLVDRVGWPVVRKPVAATGSSGVIALRSPEELAAAFEDGEGPYLFEQYLGGEEHSIEALVFRGEVVWVNVTDKTTSGPPEFVERAHLVRPGRSPLHDQAWRTIQALAAATRMRNGLVHAEVKHQGAALIEFAVRTPGDYILELIDAAWEWDVYRAVVEVALDRPPTLPSTPYPTRAAQVRFLTAARAGVLATIGGLEEARRHPGVSRADVWAEEGHEVQPARWSADRLGAVVAHGLDVGDAAAALAAAEGLISLSVV